MGEGCEQGGGEDQEHGQDQDEIRQRDEDESPVEVRRRTVHVVQRWDRVTSAAMSVRRKVCCMAAIVPNLRLAPPEPKVPRTPGTDGAGDAHRAGEDEAGMPNDRDRRRG